MCCVPRRGSGERLNDPCKKAFKLELDGVGHDIDAERDGDGSISVVLNGEVLRGGEIVSTARSGGSDSVFDIAGHEVLVRWHGPPGDYFELLVDGRPPEAAPPRSFPEWIVVFLPLCLASLIVACGVLPLIVAIMGGALCLLVGLDNKKSEAVRILSCIAITVLTWGAQLAIGLAFLRALKTS